jgi:hypothetical protein
MLVQHNYLKNYHKLNTRILSIAHFAVENLNRLPLVENKIEDKNLVLTLSILELDEGPQLQFGSTLDSSGEHKMSPVR